MFGAKKWRRWMAQEPTPPPDLPKGLRDRLTCATTLRNPGNHSCVHLIGVAHLSSRSVAEVRDAVRAIRPAMVLLELCDQRVGMLAAAEQPPGPLPELTLDTAWELRWDLVSPAFWLVQLPQAAIAALIGVQPAAEQAAGLNEAVKLGARVVLIDRPISTTFSRCFTAAWREAGPVALLRLLWETVSPLDKLGLSGLRARPPPGDGGGAVGWVAGLEAKTNELFDLADRGAALSDADLVVARRLARELVDGLTGDIAPAAGAGSAGRGTHNLGDALDADPVTAAVTEPLVAERDTWLAHQLWTASSLSAGRPMVAVIGAGHVAGVARRWGETTDDEAQRVVQVPTDELWRITAQTLGVSLAPTAAGAVAWRHCRRAGGWKWRYFRRARVAYFAAGCVGTGYFGVCMARYYERVRQLQLRAGAPAPGVAAQPAGA